MRVSISIKIPNQAGNDDRSILKFFETATQLPIFLKRTGNFPIYIPTTKTKLTNSPWIQEPAIRRIV